LNLLWLADCGDDLAVAEHTYAANSIATFPCRGKQPLTKNGLYDATTDAELIRSRRTAFPRANIGMPMGGPRRWVAIDVDGASGIATRRALERQHGALPITLRAVTGSGGEHWILVAPDGVTVRNRARIAPGIDVRADGGYIIVAPSVHPDTGERYRWLVQVAPAAMPTWLVELVRDRTPERKLAPPVTFRRTPTSKSQRWAHAALTNLAREVAEAPSGARNNTLNRAAFRLGRMIAGGLLDAGEVRATLRAAGIACGLPEREVDKVLR
jgi:Bifunctional DNA primase/polymerase, N-terminal